MAKSAGRTCTGSGPIARALAGALVNATAASATPVTVAYIASRERTSDARQILSDGGVEGWWIPKFLADANPDIKTVQDLMGHADVKTTMIYTHTAQDTGRRVMSPLDG
jgi:ABC-type proline/glycine betaine transport system substrate-binding protein